MSDLTEIPGATIAKAAEKDKAKSKAKKAKLDEVNAIYAADRAEVEAEQVELIQSPAATNPINGAGRPTIFTQEIADEFLAHVTMGRSFRKICSQDHMPSIATIYNWFRVHPTFLEQYTHAKEESADAMVEDLLDIADEPETFTETTTLADGSVVTRVVDNTRRTQLRIETRKWIATKLQPRKYGDKLDLTSGGQKLPTPLLSGLTNTAGDITANEETTE